jgi:hypothetical protein
MTGDELSDVAIFSEDASMSHSLAGYAPPSSNDLQYPMRPRVSLKASELKASESKVSDFEAAACADGQQDHIAADPERLALP